MSRASTPAGRRRPGRPTLPPDQQRERLIEAADRLLRRKKVVSFSVKEIVGEAGMSSRSFYDHFRSKDEVLIELVERASQTFLVRMAEVLAETRSAPPDWPDLLLGVYLETLAPVVALDRMRLGDLTRERVEAHRSASLRRLLDLLMLQIDAVHGAGVIERRPERAAVEMLLLGIEAMTIRFGREGRLAELAGLAPAIRELAYGLVGQISDFEA